VNCDICHVLHKSLWTEQYIYYLLLATSALAVFHLTITFQKCMFKILSFPLLMLSVWKDLKEVFMLMKGICLKKEKIVFPNGHKENSLSKKQIKGD